MLGTARLLSHANVDVICWNGSKGASLGFDADVVLCERITKETGIEATTSILALDRVLRGHGARNIALVSPHTDDYQAKVTAKFAKRGFPCVAEAHAGFSDNFSYCTVPDADIVGMIRTVAAAKPDAIVTFCTNFPAAHLVAPMEQELGLPIYDTVSIGVWDALRRAGVATARGARWGNLFTGT
jgi:maleate isomerase